MLQVALACVALEVMWANINILLLLHMIRRSINILPLLGIIGRLIGRLIRTFFLWLNSIPGKIRRNTSRQGREKYAGYAMRLSQVMFTCYCVTRMLILVTLNLLDHIRITALKKYNKLKQFWHLEFEGRSRRWSKVPDDIMHSVLQQLSTPDYFRCRAVCHPWQAFVDVGILDKLCCPAQQLPWLMFSSHPLSTTYNFFLSLSEQQKVYKPNPATYNMDRLDCVGSIEGWLIMADSALWRPEAFMFNNKVNFFFLNPMSGDRVMLPSSESSLPCKCSSKNPYFLISKVVASAVPTSQHCLVVSLCLVGHVAFCRPSDQSWTLIEGREEVAGLIFHDIEVLNGKIYAVTWHAPKFLTVIHIDDATSDGPPSYTVEKLVMLHPHWPVYYHFLDSNIGEVRLHVGEREIISLAKDSKSKELFMIFRRVHFSWEADPVVPWYRIMGKNFCNPPQTREFRVFKLERSVVGSRWVEVLDLGDRILFMSEACDKLVHAGNCLKPSGLDDKIFEKNCIYFAFDNPCSASRYKGYDVGVFSLSNRSIKRFEYPKGHPRTDLFTRPVWFTPCLW